MLVTVCTNDWGAGTAAEAPASGSGPVARSAGASRGVHGSARRHGRIAGHLLRTSLREESGFTLIEMLVASVAAITVLSATFAFLLSSQVVQARDSEWALTLQEDRAGLARMVRDIRQATKVEESKPGTIFFLATIGGKAWKIKYECGVSQSGTSYTRCVRLAAEEGTALPATGPQVAKDLVNGTAVFTYWPSSEVSKVKAATVRIELPAKGTFKQVGVTDPGHKVVLEDAAFMRNLYLEG